MTVGITAVPAAIAIATTKALAMSEWPAQFRFVTDPDDTPGWFLRFMWHHWALQFELGPDVVTAMENETQWGIIAAVGGADEF